jgi:hypothetical protein
MFKEPKEKKKKKILIITFMYMINFTIWKSDKTTN